MYVKVFAPVSIKAGTVTEPSCLPLGVWHMVNIYQYWVILEIIAFFTNFIAIMITLFVASFWHHKIKRSLTVPLALVQKFTGQAQANN
jgi:hypothetical protein